MKKNKMKKMTKKEDKLFHNIMNAIEQFMSGKSYSPQTESEIGARLHIPEQHRQLLHQILTELVNQKKVQLHLGRYTYCHNQTHSKTPENNGAYKPVASSIVTGIIHMHPRGFGFVQLENTTLYSEDIFIPKPYTNNAVDGDRVEVQVSSFISEKGPEGKVLNIIERARRYIGGVIKAIEYDGTPIAYVPLLGPNQRVVIEDSESLRIGDRVVIEIIDWGTKNTETIGKLHHHIGNIDDPSCDIPSAIKEYELRDTFPKEAVEEAKKYGIKITPKDLKNREDLCHLPTMTIDPDTAKDFDDAINIHKDDRGHFHLGVHIADVSHYVHPNTALDNEAKLRCNSTYFPGFCLPMLPPSLSENLCSLKPKVKRLTASVLMEFDPMGELINYRIVKSVIKSLHRFTYREAKDVLDGKLKSPYLPHLKLMVELCKLLKKKRYERGSIEFALPDFVVIVNEKGDPQKIEQVSYDITHQMIEEFMLKANEIVAKHVTNQGKDLTFRIHDEPAQENLKDFAQLASAFGFKLPSNPTANDFQKLFDDALDSPYGQYLATSYIRSMRLAVYSAENIGHYGLGLTHYCHFTSPIRRYIDLIVHRILFGETIERNELSLAASFCSERERISSKAENDVTTLKKLRLLEKLHQNEPYKEYAAVVTRIKPFGFFFEVLEFMIEGFLRLSDLDNDYFIYEEKQVRLRGKYTSKIYSSGDRITVMVKAIDLISLDSKWHLVSDPYRQTKNLKKPDVKKNWRKQKQEKQKEENIMQPTSTNHAKKPSRTSKPKKASSGTASRSKAKSSRSTKTATKKSTASKAKKGSGISSVLKTVRKSVKTGAKKISKSLGLGKTKRTASTSRGKTGSARSSSSTKRVAKKAAPRKTTTKRKPAAAKSQASQSAS